MSAALKQRRRIARVRRLQHGIAASSATAAAGELRNLELSRDRLGQMRSDLSATPGMTNGAWLSSAGELAMRLDKARLGLSGSIDHARDVAAAREQERIQARRSQESADKLRAKAMRAAADAADNRMTKIARPGRKGMVQQ